jgi:hypothetical protein
MHTASVRRASLRRMGDTSGSTADTLILISRVVADHNLNREVRREAEGLLPLIDQNPALAETRLEALYNRVVPALLTHPPTEDLCRCVPIRSFFLYHVTDDARSDYRDSIDFGQEVAARPDPARFLKTLLRRDAPLFRAAHSWMVGYSGVQHLDGVEIKRALALNDTHPPYVIFLMTREKLLAAGVGVRPSTALDAVPAGITYWDADGLPTGLDEYVDRDIPYAALERLEWRI